MTKHDIDKSLHVESQRHVGGSIDEFYRSIGNGSVVLPFPLYDGLTKWLLCKPPRARFIFPVDTAMFPRPRCSNTVFPSVNDMIGCFVDLPS